MTAETAAQARATREAQCCGHLFATTRQRIEHEERVGRGERVLCPCGDVCSDGES